MVPWEHQGYLSSAPRPPRTVSDTAYRGHLKLAWLGNYRFRKRSEHLNHVPNTFLQITQEVGQAYPQRGSVTDQKSYNHTTWKK